jgi:hypothetical protein
MKHKFLAFILILATLLSVAAAPMPSVTGQPALASGRVKVLSPTGQTVRPNYDNLDGKVQVTNTTKGLWKNVTIQRETGKSALSVSQVSIGDIAAGKSAIAAFDITVPSKTGTYKEIWTMSVDGYLTDRFTWSFVVSGTALKKDEHTEFTKITLATSDNTKFSLKKGQTNIDLIVTIQNLSSYSFDNQVLQYESGSKSITPNTTGSCSVPCFDSLSSVAAGDTETVRIDLKAPSSAGSYSATWILTNDGVTVGRFKFTIHVQDSTWKNPSTTSYAKITVINPTSSQKYYINDPGVDLAFDLENIGENTWDTDFYFILTGGKNMAKDGGKKFYLPVTMAPGDKFRIAFDLKAPKSAGTYTSTYAFRNASGKTIKSFTITVKVVSP